MKRATVVAAVTCVWASLRAGPLFAQAEGLDLELGGLLRTGVRFESADAGGTDGFEVYDARLGLSGRVGIVFDYRVQAEYDFDDEAFRLLDASLSIPLREETLALEVGLARSPFGLEAMRDRAEIQFVERSQASLAVAPGRQVGAQLRGSVLEDRFRYWGGVFNGNGLHVENDNDSFLFAFRAEYNSVGEIEFFEDLVFQVGAGISFSTDDGLAILPVARSSVAEEGAQELDYELFTGDRFLWSTDLRFAYRSFTVEAEYAQTEYDLESGTDFDAEALYVEGVYKLWGALDWIVRYDSFTPAAGLGFEPERNEFILLGLNLAPGFHSKLGLQYAIGLDGTLLGPPAAIDGTNTGPPLADRQFLLNLQVAL
jgi:phosphate-selective porin